MVVETYAWQGSQNAFFEAKNLRERLEAAARYLDVWFLLVFELIFIADAEPESLRGLLR